MAPSLPLINLRMGDGAMSHNLMPGLDGLLGSEYSRVDQGMSAVAIDKIDGMYNILLPLAVQRKHGFTMENVNASYLPSGTMGINQACQNKEMAREFILFVLGRDVQSKDLSDGLPVNTLAVRDWVDREDNKDTSVAVSGDDGYEADRQLAYKGRTPAGV